MNLARLTVASLLLILSAPQARSAEKPPAVPPRPETFAVETYVHRTYNYLDNMVDKDSLPYFNVFWLDPAEAAHDWPDFGDVMSRQWQAAVMARHLTGKTSRSEMLWQKKSLGYLDPKTGLLMRPKTSFSEPGADLGDQALTLFALATAYADSKDPELRAAMIKMIDHLPSLYNPNHGFRGFIIKSLTTCFRQTGYKPALDQAAGLVKTCFDDSPLFSPDNTFRHGGHMHGNLRTLVGAADYALLARDPILFSRVDALYRYVRSEGTRFGFLPEVIGRKGDVVSCETCALMDFLGLAVTLANHGHPEYWGDVERMLRNQMVESQLCDVSWLKPATPPLARSGRGAGGEGAAQQKSAEMPDTHQFTWRDVGPRMVGAYAGWTSPTHILAAREDLHWGGPELRGKTRAVQNCCGGSGTHAFFIAWKNASRFAAGTLSVNLHIDKLLPQAEIRGYQPFKGLVTIALKQSCKVLVRIPEFVDASQIQAKSDRGPLKPAVWGNYLDLGARQAGEKLEVSYPLAVRDEETVIGNPGFRQYRYRVTWKGDTVVRMALVGDNPKQGFSDFDGKPVDIFYGPEGPGPIYQREWMLAPSEPRQAPLHLDDGTLDFWYFR
jgi:hypothetical protein